MLAQYLLPLMDGDVELNPLLGKKIAFDFVGKISCVHCSKEVKKTFAQGFCYTCFRRIPEADLCIVRPETCHFHKGTCRDPEWGQKHCFVYHTVYLANSSGLKVGITRTHNEQTRWLDQGASQALPIARVSKRLQAGVLEAELRKHVSDRTNWRLLLKKTADEIDLCAKRDELLSYLPDDLVYDSLFDEPQRTFQYPVLEYPKKITTYDFLKTPRVEGVLMGIKGQYLLFEEGVLNVRKFSGFSVVFSAE
jgi:hypothetical protein